MTSNAAEHWGHGSGLLERSADFALDVVRGVTREALSRPTPCSEWDLRALLHHVNDSVTALREGLCDGHVALDPARHDGRDGHQRHDGRGGTFDSGLAEVDLIAGFRERTVELIGAWRDFRRARGISLQRDRGISVADMPLSDDLFIGIGAVEIAVHGWDIAQACGDHRQIPWRLATDLMEICPWLVADDIRFPLFAPQVAVPTTAGPSDRLLAFLGRSPNLRV
jgi:uncharacterized protein (TIGR03086 family)